MSRDGARNLGLDFKNNFSTTGSSAQEEEQLLILWWMTGTVKM